MVGLGSSWGPACGHPVQPGAQFCNICGQAVSAPADVVPPDGGTPLDPAAMTQMAPPPPADSRQGWPPPPAGFPSQRLTAPLPDLVTGQVGEGEDDPWASWYGKPRTSPADSPSATLPRVTGGVPAAPGPQAPPGGGPQPWHQPQAWDAGPGQQFGATQRLDAGQPYGAAPPYGPPQYTGAMPYAEQPPYGGPQQYAGPQQYGQQYGDSPYGGPAGPGVPGPPAGRKSRGPLIPALAIGAAAVIAVVALLLATSSSGSSSSSTAASGATGAATSSAGAPAAREQAAHELAGLLAQSGNDHSAVNAAVGDVEACKSLRDARSTFGTSARNRETLLARLGSLPHRAALPASLLQELTVAWQASAQVDNDLHDWAQDEISGGCHPKKVLSDPKYQASLGPDNTASSHKAEFAKGWAPIARQYDLPAYSYDQI